MLSTGLTCGKDGFDGREFTSCARDYRHKNARLATMWGDLQTFLLTFDDKGRTNKEVKEHIEREVFGKEEQAVRRTLASTIEEYMAKCINRDGTRKCYGNTLGWVRSYKDVILDDVTLDWLRGFEEHMSDLKTNSRSIHLRNIRTVMNYAIDEEYTTRYPFRKFHIRSEETKKRSLTVEQLRQLRDYRCTESWQCEARDMFMLQFYLLGINNADLFTLPALTDGRTVYHRMKTGKLYDVAVPVEAKRIIRKYKGVKHLLSACDRYKSYKDYVHHMNDHLKTIGKRVGNGKKTTGEALFPDLSFYWSRHTFATLMAEIDIPMETISRALGHSSACSTTQIYIKFSQSKVDAAQRELIDFVNSDMTAEQWKQHRLKNLFNDASHDVA